MLVSFYLSVLRIFVIDFHLYFVIFNVFLDKIFVADMYHVRNRC